MTDEELIWMLRNNCGVSEAAVNAAHEAADRIEELEDRLAKAVELAEKSIKWLRLYGADVHREAATLAELTGGKDE